MVWKGLLFLSAMPKAIQDRMQLLADDPNLRREMGAAALRRVRSMGGWAGVWGPVGAAFVATDGGALIYDKWAVFGCFR